VVPPLSCSGSGSSFFSPPSLAQIIVYQWYCNILIRQLVFSPSIVNQVQDPSISLYLTVHSPAALILSDQMWTRGRSRTATQLPFHPPRRAESDCEDEVKTKTSTDGSWERASLRNQRVPVPPKPRLGARESLTRAGPSAAAASTRLPLSAT